MSKALNLSSVRIAMEALGLNAAAIAKNIGVSRETVSKWLNSESVPRPDKLLRLALLLDLKLGEITQPPEQHSEPIIAFRKRGSTKTSNQHISRAKEMGRLLKPLVPYLPFDEFVRPPTLKKPAIDYGYLQQVTGQVRARASVTDTDAIDFRHLIKRFAEMQTVLIPVLWGKKGHHENALHIFLPDSMTTWVYLNLDVAIHDFKFWMAHELGHVHAPDLVGDSGEDFADAFAGALLFPRPLAEDAYQQISQSRRKGTQVNRIKAIAEENLISPISVYIETNKYAEYSKCPRLDLEPGIFGAAKNLSKSYYSVSESLFGTTHPDARKYIAFAKELDSPIFDSLAAYLCENDKGPGFVQAILDVTLLDSREIHAELT